MATIDDKVVAMSFESSKFEQGVSKTISALDKLKAALHFPNAGKGLQDVDAAAKKINLGHIGKAVDDVKNRLNAFRLVAIAVFAQVAQKALAAGTNFVKAFTLDPVKAGFSEYTTNLNAVQTILANTQAAGTKLKDVNAALKELNEYSDRTIYNFSQMARNIGTFTAAGVQLDVATGAIKGIANLAALSGSNAEQASTAMYQLSQAISAGRVSLQDWNSVVNAGMGGTVFQRALAQTAVAMGTLKEDSLKLVGPMKNVSIAGESFRASLQAGPGKPSWLTSDVLTRTLEQFTGDLTKAELKAQGFNDAQIKAIQQTATTAMKAATEVKTLQGVLDTAKETAVSGWAETWQIIFGDFGEAKVLFTGVSNAINGFISSSADARNKVLADWKALGGRTLLIKAIKEAFQALGDIIRPIKQAFRDIFPAQTGKDLYNLTVQFKEFTATLKPSPETVENLRRTFRGLFALLSIGKQVISGIFGVFRRLIGATGAGSGGFLSFTANIGDFLVKVDQALKKGQRLNQFFERLGDILVVPIEMLKDFQKALANLFKFSSGGTSGEIDAITSSMTVLQGVMESIAEVWNRFMDALGGAGEILEPLIESYANLFAMLPDLLSQAIQNMNFEAILAVIRTGLLGGIFLMFKQFFGKGPLLDQIAKGFGGGILENISGSFGALEGSMKALQTNIKAKTLKEIAIAIALLTASVVALSFVDPERLKSSLTAMTVGFGQLLGAMVILEKVSTSTGFLKLPFITGSLILLAGAIDLLAVAVIALAQLSWNELLKGLGGVGFLLLGISRASGPLSANSAGLIRASIGITGIAIALNLLALAVRQFGTMDMGTLAKGLVSVSLGLEILSNAMQRMPKGMVAQSAALILIAGALILLAEAVEKFGTMNWSVIAKGMGSLALSLGIIAGAMRVMPKGMVAQAAALLLVAAALQGIVLAVGKMGGMSVEQLAKGLISLAAALAILAAALHLMKTAAAGAAALALAATGLSLLAPALVLLGKQSWEQIIKGLVALAAAIGLIAVAGMVLQGALPGLLGLGAAMMLIGGGLALAGAGIALVGIGLSAIAVSGPVALGVLTQAFVQFQRALIENAKLIVLGLLEIVKAFAASAPEFAEALAEILISMLDVIIEAAPKMAEVMDALIKAMLKVIDNNSAAIIASGFKILIELLQGIRANIGEITRLVVDIIGKFLNGLAQNIRKIVDGGVRVLTAFLLGIARNLARVATAAISIVTRFLSAIASGMGKVVSAGANIVVKLLSGIAKNIGRVITAGTNIIVNFIRGVGNAGPRIVTAATNAMIKFINALSKNAVKLADAGAQAIINFLNGVARVIEQREPEMIQAGFRIGVAIVKGMINGLASMAGQLVNKAKDLGKSVIKGLGKAAKVFSPSKEAFDIGRFIVLGLANGLSNYSEALDAAEGLSKSVIGMFNDVFQTASPSKVMYEIGKFVTQGFAQGLRSGSRTIIRDALTELKTQLQEGLRETRQQLAAERAELKKLQAEKGKSRDPAAIKAAQKAIRELTQDQKELQAAIERTNTKGFAKQRKELMGLAKEYANVSQKLDEAKDRLKELIQVRDDAAASYKEKYSILPEIVMVDEEGKPISPEDQLKNWMSNLRTQIAAVKTFHTTLQQLRKLGLGDAAYMMLLEEGPAAQAFASALLTGGEAAVKEVNSLTGELEGAADALGTSAAKNLYDAGIKAAQGIVDGLIAKKADIQKEMNDIALGMVKTIKKALKIKSPSEVFAEIGRLSMEGMAQGFSDSSALTETIDDVAVDAVAQMQKSMSELSTAIAAEIDPTLVITPVLDLTQVRSQAGELAALANVVPITAGVSSGHALAISAGQIAAQIQDEQAALALGGTAVKFEQNNYSPKALTEIEIYRQTRNQLSQLKSTLVRS